MSNLSLQRLFLGLSVSLIIAFSAHAFSFKDLKRQAEKAMKEAESALETTKPSSGTPAPTNNSCRSHPRAKRVDELPQPVPRGYKPDSVYYIQRGLCLLGYYSGEQNSIYDDRTRQAIEAYQRKRGLTVDGAPSHVVVRYVECDLTPSTKKEKKDTVCAYAEQLRARDEQEAKQKKMRAAEQQQIVEGASKEIPMWKQKSIFQVGLLAVRFAPELLDDPDTLKMWAQSLYPAEWAKIKDNEFEVRRQLPAYKARIIQHAKNQPTTYRVLHGTGLRDYDFQRQGYSFAINLADAFRGERVVLNKELPVPPRSVFVPIKPDRAEALVKSTKLVTFELVFEATGAVVDDRYRGAGASLLCEAKRLRVYGKQVNRAYRDSAGRSVTYSVLSDPIADVDLSRFETSSAYLSMQAQSQRPQSASSVPQTPANQKKMKMDF